MTVPQLLLLALSAALLGWAIAGLATRAAAVASRRLLGTGGVDPGMPDARVGWLAILICTAVMLGLWTRPPAAGHAVLLAVAAGLAVVGWLGRRVEVWPATRWFARAVGVIMALDVLAPGARIADMLPLWAERSLVALAWLAVIEAVAALDERADDGPAGGAATAATAIALGHSLVSMTAATDGAMTGLMPALALGGACVGALVWAGATTAARLGKTGAAPLGFLCGYLLIDLAARVDVAAAVILSLVLVTEAWVARLQGFARGDACPSVPVGDPTPLDPRGQAFLTAAIRDRRVLAAALVACAVATRWAPWLALAMAAAVTAAYLVRLSARSERRRRTIRDARHAG